MISLPQLEPWVRAGESETLEYKRTTGERRAATQTLCGMLNHRGGRVLFGVEPNGRILACLSGAAQGCALRDIRKALGGAIPEWEIKNDLAALMHLGLVATSAKLMPTRTFMPTRLPS